LTSGRWAAWTTASTTTGATLRSIRFEIIVGLPDFVHFFKPHRAEDNGEEFHRGVALRRGHLLEADSAARHDARRKIGPSLPLFVVIKSVKYMLPLIGV
jgi:hypothetical protein